MVKAVAPAARPQRRRRQSLVTVDHAATLALEPLLAPFVVLIDQQEKAPWLFQGITTRVAAGLRRIHVRTETGHLKTGDYSIRGHESRIIIERKSLSDLFGTVGSGRDRFRAEHERMAAIIAAGGRAYVLLESCKAEWDASPPERCQVSPDAVTGTMDSWSWRYGVRWHMCGSRPAAEDMAWLLLNKYWTDLKRAERETARLENTRDKIRRELW